MHPDPLDHLPLTRQHLRVLIVCTLGSFWDMTEINIGSVLSSVYSLKTSPMTSGQLSWLLASMYVGAIIGAPVLGWLADRYGRRPALVTTLSILAAASVAAALTPDVRRLTAFRMLSGFAIGGYPAVMITYVTDLMPVRQRGRMMLLATGLSALAGPVTLFGAKLLTSIPFFGLGAWRWICGGAGVGAALTAAYALRLGESPRWLRANGYDEQAKRAQHVFESSPPVLAQWSRSTTSPAAPPVPVRGAATLPDGFSLGRAALVAALCFLSPWSTVGFSLLSGAVLINKGFDLASTFLFTGIVSVGSVLGLILVAGRIDRLERRTTLLIAAVSMGVTEVLFGIATSPWMVTCTGLLFLVCTAVYVLVLSFYIAELFPTRTRALATSTTWAVNRAASVLTPLVLLPILTSRGPLWMCGTMAATLLASAVLLTVAPRGHAGQPVS